MSAAAEIRRVKADSTTTMRFFRFLRGVLGTAITWGVAWVPLSLIPFGLIALVNRQVPSAAILGTFAAGQGLMGAINGSIFATVVAIMGRRKTFDSLSLRWIAVCGALGGALFPFAARSVLIAATGLTIPVTALAISFVSNAVLGAGFAALSLSIARRPPSLASGSRAGTPAVTRGAA